ncbi:uncharacterized protein CELE_ZK816.3 [Caenorhabditis elegans]|uniref:Uncharacterized protein n=1 Tax=Caenorhabditis elegans TaxID=6239 RepID=Q23609_CAEEL|nr:Uncharacterized protein CELE_ZK816.3 [Caenorhabditis elegans]CCD69239.2 Uncharacterized protein CELE_ZK816.3 [Caenorhabditis elegans]
MPVNSVLCHFSSDFSLGLILQDI